MKNLYLLILIAWSVYAIINYGYLKPKDDYFLFFLCAISVLISVIGIVIYLYDNKK